MKNDQSALQLGHSGSPATIQSASGAAGSDGPDADQEHGASRLGIHAARRALIVEDEMFVAWHLESIVNDLKIEVGGILPDGESAVERVGDGDIDLVLMDIHLAGAIDGVEAARRIRAISPVPIIFISAFSDLPTRERIATHVAGAPLLNKPVGAERLQAAIEDAWAGGGR